MSSCLTRLRGIDRSSLVASSLKCKAAGRDIRAQIGARDVEERPDHAARARQDAGEAARTGAAQQPQQERFGLVVEAVADRDRVGREPIGRLLEKRVAKRARRVFDRPTAARARPLARRRGRHSIGRRERRRHRPAERLVRVGVRAAELMIEVGDAREPHMTAVLELTQNVDERDRVGSARERDDDTPARLDERIAPDGAQDGSGE